MKYSRLIFLVLLISCIACQSCKEESLAGKDIHVSAMAGRIDSVERLIDSGISVNERGDREATAVFYSAGSYHFELTNFLIERGADVTLLDYDQETPLHWIAHGPIPDHRKDEVIRIIELLIEAGVDTEARDSSNQTAAELAFETARISEELDICNQEVGDFLTNHKEKN